VTGFAQVFAWPTFGLMLIGMALGFVVGLLLPGLGGPTTLALMLPFVFKMTPIEAFAFLLGMLAVTATTGDITSILFGIPGEPTTAATIVDGHAMAKNGEAGRALGAAMMSSLIGTVFGAVVLGHAIPIVRPLVLTLGSPEFFMLARLGITFVASLSGEALLNGLLAGGLGLWLATIGLDPVTGTYSVRWPRTGSSSGTASGSFLSRSASTRSPSSSRWRPRARASRNSTSGGSAACGKA